MRYANVKMIVAVGNSGQLGLKGVLPWHAPEDLKLFKAVTMGGICIVGKATAQTLPKLEGRDVVVWERDKSIAEFVNAHRHRDIWVCGGVRIYMAWREHASLTILSHIDYDGPADTHMPRLWRRNDTKSWNRK